MCYSRQGHPTSHGVAHQVRGGRGGTTSCTDDRRQVLHGGGPVGGRGPGAGLAVTIQVGGYKVTRDEGGQGAPGTVGAARGVDGQQGGRLGSLLHLGTVHPSYLNLQTPNIGEGTGPGRATTLSP